MVTPRTPADVRRRADVRGGRRGYRVPMAVTTLDRKLPAWLVDVALAVAVAAFELLVTSGVADSQAGERSLDAFAYGSIVAASVLLLLRRRWPFAVLAGTVAIDVVYVARLYPGGPGPCVAAVAALATVATRFPPGPALLAGGGALVAELIAVLGFAGQPPLDPAVLRQFAWVSFGLLAGTALRAQRASVEAIGARAREAERTRAEEARRQLGEERLRIARELHDVLAHSLAMIHVQASSGAHVVQRRPEQAQQVLSAIKQASGEALADLRTTVGVLRGGSGDDDERDGAPSAPQPSLARVEELIDGARRAGAQVEVDVTGERRRLPVPVDVAGYRIVQEALTNVVRHAGAGRVRVALTYEDDGIALLIDDDGRGIVASKGGANGAIAGSGDAAAGANGANGAIAGSGDAATGANGAIAGSGDAAAGANGATAGGGHGLAGMRERAALLGGSVEAGPRPGGGFRVRARLPLGAP
jgi:signal transduction histidine kinase